MGGDGQLPPVPPTCYWSHKYQSAYGDCCIESWFNGYQDGAGAAQAACLEGQNDIPFSPRFQQCEPGCLSTDHSPYPYGRTTLPPRIKERKKEPTLPPDLPPLNPDISSPMPGMPDSETPENTPELPKPDSASGETRQEQSDDGAAQPAQPASMNEEEMENGLEAPGADEQ